ncbi:MAG: ATP-binding protein [Candidatus Magnetoovum sp. WYHC-5]|nr:ATP-binding protein [Candidatus Magnetoovum sp. WYHC-5]
MIASSERQHKERLPHLNKYKTRILPIAAIYGGNASGKSNFFKAINFARNCVVKSSQPDSIIPVEPFRLDPTFINKPTRFSFELLIENNIYEFSFAVTRKAVVEEKLVQISITSEKILYDRKENKPHFDSSLKKDKSIHYAFKGTNDNQLFLTNSVSQKIDKFRPVYDWFKNTLRLIGPDSRFGQFVQLLDDENPLHTKMNKLLERLDTGIISIKYEDFPFEKISLPESVKTALQEDIKEGMTIGVDTPNKRFSINRRNEELIAKKLIAYHLKSDGTTAQFEIEEESDGSQRIIDLLPAFLMISETSSQNIFVIDELDRSLHTLLTRELINAYLDSCSPESRSQLLFTTHDVLLMDQQLLRRDEMWVVERDYHNVSNMLSFSEYKDIRYDKDIRKSYLQGRLGGIPRLLLGGQFNKSSLKSEKQDK